MIKQISVPVKAQFSLESINFFFEIDSLQLNFKEVYNKQLQQMETTFPWYHYQILQMMYNAYPITSEQMNSYRNKQLNFGRINTQQSQFQNFNHFHKDQEIVTESHHQFTPITLKFPQDQMVLKNSQEISNCRQTNKQKNKQILDQNEYVPMRKISKTPVRKTNYSSLKQNRNILPNAIHQILSYVQRKNKSYKIVQRLIDKYNSSQPEIQDNSESRTSDIPQISSARFYAYQNQLKAQMPNYVKLATLKYICTEQSVDWNSDVFSVTEQIIYNKICRTLVIYYLNTQVVCVIMSSKRMQKDKKKEHLKVNRKIEAYIRQGFQEERIQENEGSHALINCN